MSNCIANNSGKFKAGDDRFRARLAAAAYAARGTAAEIVLTPNGFRVTGPAGRHHVSWIAVAEDTTNPLLAALSSILQAETVA
jgi:hypothetical protein